MNVGSPCWTPPAPDGAEAAQQKPLLQWPIFTRNLLAGFARKLTVKRSPAGVRNSWAIARRWCAIFEHNFADGETLRALVALLHDPKTEVRLWAVHSLACEDCKDGPNPIDPVPLLLERIERDANVKVRRQAVAILAHHRTPDARVVPVFKKIASDERDRKLLLHAEQGLKRYAAAGW